MIHPTPAQVYLTLAAAGFLAAVIGCWIKLSL